jgi:hypothetical protein
MFNRRDFMIAAFCLLGSTERCHSQESLGRFVGEFDARFNSDGRTVTLLSKLEFIDPDGASWTAPLGIVVNGASIPWPLWSIVGAPYTGNYRRASVIHDHYCETKEKSWQETHYTFYLAARVDGVSDMFAKLLYGGVLAFGPRWKKDRATGKLEITTPELKEGDFNNLKDWILKENPNLQEINRRILG